MTGKSPKVAEDFLQQIDQQAAESLGKQEKPGFHDLGSSASVFSETSPLQDQRFKPKGSHESLEFLKNNRSVTNVETDKPSQVKYLQGVKKSSPSINPIRQQEVALVKSSSIRTRVAKPLPDDWTELLASPELSTRGNNDGTSSKDAYSNSNGISNGVFFSSSSKHTLSNSSLGRTSHQVDASSASIRFHDSKKNVNYDGKLRQHSEFDYRSKAGHPQGEASLKYSNEHDTIPDSSSSIQRNGYDSSSSEVSPNGWNGKDKVHRKSYEQFEANQDAKESNEAPSTSDVKEHGSTRVQPLENSGEASSEPACDSYDKNLDISSYNQNNRFEQKDAELIGINENGIPKGKSDDSPLSPEEIKTDVASLVRDGKQDQCQHDAERDGFNTDASEVQIDDIQSHYKQVQEIPTVKLDGVHYSSSQSDGRSETETDSASASDSEDDEVERRKQSQRKRRAAQEAAEAAALEAAKAAIKEREEFVMRLEREKERLEQILAEREEKQAREAVELQMNMKETMQAVDLEKQNHNITRMEALARVAALETENADLAMSLAAVQRNLELELDHVADLRRDIESKEVAQAELERRLALLRHTLAGSDQVDISKQTQLEQEGFDERKLNLCEKIEQVQVKVKQLEENIERTTEAWEGPTEVEVELESRLSQLTDHLIQKQAQVETLSAEKATLLFRLEALSNTLYEERYLAQSQTSKGNKSNYLDSISMDEDVEFGLARPYDPRRGIYENEDFERSPIFFLLRQFDMIFSAGAYYLRRHGIAKCFALIYLLALHIWVIFVMFLRTHENQDIKSGALFSLESINNGTNSLNSTLS
ncbi:hypothetical protein SUGI_0225950 [Cryptomeria japonica]|nr:hypothetical protein SUGI_0225950 [Cryptomeria japonica]